MTALERVMVRPGLAPGVVHMVVHSLWVRKRSVIGVSNLLVRPAP